MCYASIYEAKTQLSKYVSMIENGETEEVILMKNGKKVAKIISYSESPEPVRLGAGLLVSEAKPFVMDEKDDDLEGLFGY